MKPTYAVFNALAFGIIGLVLIVATVTLLVTGHGLITSLLVGLAWGVLALGILLTVAQVVIPGMLIRWREQLMSSSKVEVNRSIGEGVSRILAISGPKPWESTSARLRVRIYGAIFLVVFIAVGVALVVIVGPLDAAISRHA